uniref:Retrovirus-related Pol polyprotein from transposon TNT 1-94 n=1 Tax=Lygus hesperus TaxID=30085 RepID=A0A0A9XVJ9_LYGHE
MSSLISQVEKLKGRDNYGSWKVEMRAALRIEKLWTDVVEMKTKDEKGVLKQVDPEKDEAALARITLCVDKSLHSHIRTADSAFMAWNSLAKAFDDSGLLRRVMLLQDLSSCRLVDFESPSAYCDKLITTAQKLNDLNFVVSDEWLGSLLLAGLPLDYRPMIMGLENSGVNITADLVKCRILQDVLTTSTNNESALFVKKGNKKKIKCFKCNLYGHYANKCGASAQGNESVSKPDRGDRERKQRPKGGDRRTFLTAVSTSSNSWYLDSGSSCHITNTEGHLLDAKSSDVTTIATADNNNMLVNKQGRVELKVEANGNIFDIDVTDTLYVPGATANLLSVSKIVKNGNKVVFSKQGARVYDKNGILFATADIENSIYRLNVVPTQSSFLAAASTDLWHHRLGHLNQKGIEYLKDNASGITGDTKMSKICEICIRGKHARSPFRNSTKRADEILGLIHSDLCCMETASIGGARYMLTCLDDYSRYVHVYTLKEKSQVAGKLKEFCALVENQTGQRIKLFRSDGGTEFCNSLLDSFFKSKGIVHQKSTRYTPQSNGRAERVQRTLVEKGRSMLADAGLSKVYWNFAVLAAAYLQNRSPARVLDGKTPFELWTGQKPDLSNLRVFGCEAWVQVPKQRRKKWDEKSEKLIFIGYPEDYKAYRFIHPRTKDLVVSRDVVFMEGSGSSEVEDGIESLPTEVPVSLPVPAATESQEDPETSQVKQETQQNKEDDPTLVPLPGCSDDEEDFLGWDDSVIPDDDDGGSSLRRSERVPKPRTFPDYVTYYTQGTFDADEPLTYEQAVESPDAASWNLAMEDEFSSLKKNETFSVVELPAGKKTLSTRWVYRIKGKLCVEKGT